MCNKTQTLGLNGTVCVRTVFTIIKTHLPQMLYVEEKHNFGFSFICKTKKKYSEYKKYL